MTTHPAAPPAPLAELADLSVVPGADRLDVEATPASEFAGFAGRHRDRLVRLARRRLDDDGDAEEVAQETLLRAFQHRQRFATEQDAAHWMAAVAGNLVIDRTRGRARAVPVAELPAQARTARDTADVVIARDEARAALDVLDAMPARQAAIVWAREIEGQSYDEIAERFGLTEPAVRSLLHRGRAALRRGFERRGHSRLHGIPLLAGAAALWRGVRRTTQGVARTGPAGLTAIALAGLAVVGIGLGPAEWPPDSDAVVQPAPPVQKPASAAPAERRKAKPQIVAARRSNGSPPRTPPPTQRRRPLVPVPKTCVRTLGVNPCIENGQHSEPDTVWLEAPDNPTGKRAVGVDLQGVGGCATLPSTPVAKCGPGSSEPVK